MKKEKIKKQYKTAALKHIKRCDEIFDGNVVKQDREFAYNEMRLLALELLEEIMAR